ncbi:hypothetical protein ACLHDG_14280 [Sulfurovum sp. CS9]|uniref:hypothetical protein n=1 Tax=Sulfurovum sp. CS9 TaxID=3391146 RepID=UPI0039EAE6D2
MKKCSQQFKQMQRERISITKPWLKSTGSKTLDGKEKSKMNALKISLGLHSLIEEYKQLMIEQKKIYNTIT